jgi:hypothetical protein
MPVNKGIQNLYGETTVKKCSVCGMGLVFLLNMKTKKIVPVDSSTVTKNDTMFVSGRHVSHFSTCTDPREFAKVREKPEFPCREPGVLDGLPTENRL